MKKKLSEQQLENLAGMDARPGPSTLPDSYFHAVLPPELANKVRPAKGKSKAA